ncbi:MAG TPA: alpha-galactosidase, partial [Terriglobia bacterium]|nr:alpha-galactosidase [Terriglobia bacterium]
MDRRQFMASSLTGLSVAWAQGQEQGGGPKEAEGFASVDAVAQLPALPADKDLNSVSSDWLVTPFTQKTDIYRTAHRDEIAMTNGLIRRSWRLRPNAATVGFDNLMTGASILRGVKPEAYVELNWQELAVGGLKGQPDYAYLKPEWVDRMTADPQAMRCTGFKTGKTQAPFAWKRTRFSGNQPWPPPGASLMFRYEAKDKTLAGITVYVHYEMYDGIPLLAKWLTIRNGSSSRVRLNRFTNEILAAVEYESAVSSGRWQYPNIHVESDYEFGGGMTSGTCNQTAHWAPDPDYTTQVNYKLETPCLLQVQPPLGPDIDILPGKTFESYRTYELVYDSTDRERKGLALRRMYRAIAPWAMENPIFMHVTSEKPKEVKSAIDQAAEVGFEMVIISFGSGFDPENQDPKFIEEMKAL